MSDDLLARCELCGEPMPDGEDIFKYHGYSGPCPKPPLTKLDQAGSSFSARWQELFWALPPGPMRHKLRSLEIDIGRALRERVAPVEADIPGCTVKGLRDQLADYPDDTKVLAYNGDDQAVVTATGLLYDPVGKTLEICTDDNS